MEVKAPEVKPKRKYTFSAEMQKLQLFRQRVRRIERMLVTRKRYERKAEAAAKSLKRFDARLRAAKNVLVKHI